MQQSNTHDIPEFHCLFVFFSMDASPAGAQGVEQQCPISGCRDDEVQLRRQRQARDCVLVAVQHMAGGLLQLQRGAGGTRAPQAAAAAADVDNIPDDQGCVPAPCANKQTAS